MRTGISIILTPFRPAASQGASATGIQPESEFGGPPSRIKPLGPDIAERVVTLTLADPPAEATHWTAAMMAQHTGINASAVRRIWRAHGLQPHRYGVAPLLW